MHPPIDLITELSEHLKLLERHGVRFVEAGSAVAQKDRPAAVKLAFVIDESAFKSDAQKELVSKMIKAMGFEEKDVKVVAVSGEGGAEAYPAAQVIVAFGEAALRALLPAASLDKMRGRFMDFDNGAKVLPTHSLSRILKDPNAKAEAWRNDLQKVIAEFKT
jgi:hypothetical protein